MLHPLDVQKAKKASASGGASPPDPHYRLALPRSPWPTHFLTPSGAYGCHSCLLQITSSESVMCVILRNVCIVTTGHCRWQLLCCYCCVLACTIYVVTLVYCKQQLVKYCYHHHHHHPRISSRRNFTQVLKQLQGRCYVRLCYIQYVVSPNMKIKPSNTGLLQACV